MTCDGPGIPSRWRNISSCFMLQKQGISSGSYESASSAARLYFKSFVAFCHATAETNLFEFGKGKARCLNQAIIQRRSALRIDIKQSFSIFSRKPASLVQLDHVNETSSFHLVHLMNWLIIRLFTCFIRCFKTHAKKYFKDQYPFKYLQTNGVCFQTGKTNTVLL